jgi:lipopolysaccharide export LptBFGC system permease protein LptF
MSKTLFWYIFWNLLRVFILTTAGLAGIMCFAGLLRPLTENGLDLGQVSRMLLYLMPATCSYSLPVAALFASTMVYGKFSADNELTAMRAGGIGFISLRRFSIALPALVLGLLVAIVSLLMFCFVVPIFTLKVEQIIYSNIAKVIANKIERNHEIEFPDAGGGKSLNVFAQGASLPPPDPENPALQRVLLVGPAMVNFEDSPPVTDLKIPREFYMARTAILSIDRGNAGPTSAATLSVLLSDGIKFPRIFAGNVLAGVGETTFGPVSIRSPISENVKFMDVTRLARLYRDPGESDKVKVVVQTLVLREQERRYLQSIARQINSHDTTAPAATQGRFPSSNVYRFVNHDPGGDDYTIGGVGASAQFLGAELAITAPPQGPQTRTVSLQEQHGSQETLWALAKEIRIRAKPDPMNPRMAVSIDLYDTELHTQDVVSERLSYPVALSVPMPDEIKKIAGKTLAEYKNDSQITAMDAFALNHEQIVASNAVASELNGRASFAVSCLVLVMVGCALGIMFRSGNFMTAFAASFIPALLCITLIVCGQQVATHVPFDPGPGFRNPLPVSLWFIWTGNLVVLAAAIYLTGRLQKR